MSNFEDLISGTDLLKTLPRLNDSQGRPNYFVVHHTPKLTISVKLFMNKNNPCFRASVQITKASAFKEDKTVLSCFTKHQVTQFKAALMRPHNNAKTLRVHKDNVSFTLNCLYKLGDYGDYSTGPGYDLAYQNLQSDLSHLSIRALECLDPLFSFTEDAKKLIWRIFGNFPSVVDIKKPVGYEDYQKTNYVLMEEELIMVEEMIFDLKRKWWPNK